MYNFTANSLVGRLPDEATEEDVRTFFRQFGKLKKINLHRGYGFVVRLAEPY
jgi:RNA recognition motif-containing protein